MMSRLAFLCLFLLSPTAGWTGTLKTRLVQIDELPTGQEIAVYVEGEGRVLWVNSSDQLLLEALREALLLELQVRISYDEEASVRGVELLEQVEKNTKRSLEAEHTVENFNPSVLDLARAQYVFDSMDTRTRWKSQCYNRAHGWAYDMHKEFSVNSMKMFIFFTSRYIQRYRYKWWFHVAPYVLVKTENASEERVMDATYTNGPLDVRSWTNVFMKNDALCPSVNRYSEYRRNQRTQDCYLIRANMYYSSPSDLRRLETENRQETGWSIPEVRRARKQAFKFWFLYNP